MKVPTVPCPIQGLVPWERGIFPITSKRPHPVLHWLYTIHVRHKDQGLVVHHNVSQEELVQEMQLHMRFKIGESVELGPFARRLILGRKWQFQQGTVIYKIEGPRPGRELYMEQQELIRRVEKVAVG